MTMYARNEVTLFDKFSRVHRRRQATAGLNSAHRAVALSFLSEFIYIDP